MKSTIELILRLLSFVWIDLYVGWSISAKFAATSSLYKHQNGKSTDLYATIEKNHTCLYKNFMTQTMNHSTKCELNIKQNSKSLQFPLSYKHRIPGETKDF